MEIANVEKYLELLEQCEYSLLGHRESNKLKPVYQELVNSIGDDERFDNYGKGDLIENFEAEIADLFGKEASIFLPSGTMAQQIALKIWCDKKSNYNVAFHPTAHLEFAEMLGYQFLFNIKRIQFGIPEFVGNRTLKVSDFENLAQKPAAILIELPYRPLGGELPSWEELVKISEWAKSNEVYMHLDGARLWECKVFYGKEYSEICSFFDSVYVSFYKGLGGLTGSALIGSSEFIAESKIWQRRMGGNLYSLSPYVLSARLSVKKNLDKIEKFVFKAREIAEIFSKHSRIRVHPNPPHTNMFLVYIEADAKEFNEKHLEIMEKYKVALFPKLTDSEIPGFLRTEVHIFERALNFDNELLKKMVDELFK